MADPFYELLVPYFDSGDASRPLPPAQDPVTAKYLNRLSTLSLPALKTTEPESILQSSHSTLRSLQALSNRSHKAFITSSDNLSTLRTSIPQLTTEAQALQDAIPRLDEEAVRFSSTYNKTVENRILDRRKKAMQLARNVDRLSDIMELPTLLSTAVTSSSANTAGASSASYSSALDLFAHIKRLQTLYPKSPLVKDVAGQAEDAMRDMTTSLITSLKAQNIRLAAAMRTVGWLRRVAPELESSKGEGVGSGTGEGAFGALFLVCRLANLLSMLEALEPLRELADLESSKRKQAVGKQDASATGPAKWAGGHQTERYLKRYIEIFREQSFAIVSLYKNIFASAPSETDLASASVPGLDLRQLSLRTKPSTKPQAFMSDPLQTLPPALATFPMHLMEMLTETLRTYLPNVQDKGSRESLLTQVLYCASSLGRLGGDFSCALTLLEVDSDEDEDDHVFEWEEVMRKHRALAGRLEQLTSGSGAP